MSGAVSVCLTSRLGSTRPTIAVGLELEAITMVVMGGVSILGGSGTIPGVMLAALIMGMVTFGFGLLNVPGIVMSICRIASDKCDFAANIVEKDAFVTLSLMDIHRLRLVGRVLSGLAPSEPLRDPHCWLSKRDHAACARRSPPRRLRRAAPRRTSHQRSLMRQSQTKAVLLPQPHRGLFKRARNDREIDRAESGQFEAIAGRLRRKFGRDQIPGHDDVAGPKNVCGFG